MTATITQNETKPHDLIIAELAQRYGREGYTVTISPHKEELPEFLHPFHPDIVAIRPDRSVVVEVRSKGKVRRSDYWREMQAATEAHDWHLELIVNSPAEEVESLSFGEIEVLSAQAQVLSANGASNAALLVLWSAIEAAGRLAMEKYNYPLPAAVSPRGWMITLYSNGLLDKEIYDVLLVLSEKRNRIAHGYHASVTTDDINQLVNAIKDLLTE